MSNQTQQPEPEFAAFVGIDWADRQHFWACQMPGSRRIEQGELPQTPEAVEEWAMELHRRFGGAPMAIALEQSRGALIFLLGKYAHLILYPVHPTSLANYRKTFRPSAITTVTVPVSGICWSMVRSGGKIDGRPSTSSW